jgi:MoxR-like ATPase
LATSASTASSEQVPAPKRIAQAKAMLERLSPELVEDLFASIRSTSSAKPPTQKELGVFLREYYPSLRKLQALLDFSPDWSEAAKSFLEGVSAPGTMAAGLQSAVRLPAVSGQSLDEDNPVAARALTDFKKARASLNPPHDAAPKSVPDLHRAPRLVGDGKDQLAWLSRNLGWPFGAIWNESPMVRIDLLRELTHNQGTAKEAKALATAFIQQTSKLPQIAEPSAAVAQYQMQRLADELGLSTDHISFQVGYDPTTPLQPLPDALRHATGWTLVTNALDLLDPKKNPGWQTLLQVAAALSSLDAADAAPEQVLSEIASRIANGKLDTMSGSGTSDVALAILAGGHWKTMDFPYSLDQLLAPNSKDVGTISWYHSPKLKDEDTKNLPTYSLLGVDAGLTSWVFESYAQRPEDASRSVSQRAQIARTFTSGSWKEVQQDWDRIFPALPELLANCTDARQLKSAERYLMNLYGERKIPWELVERTLGSVKPLSSPFTALDRATESLLRASSDPEIHQAAQDVTGVLQSLKYSGADRAGLARTTLDRLYAEDLSKVPPLAELASDGPSSVGDASEVSVFSGERFTDVGGVPLRLNDTQDKDELAIPTAEEADLVMTPTTQANLEKLAVLWASGASRTLEGPTSGGKTSLLTYLAWRTQTPLRRINLSADTEVADLVGHWIGKEKRFTRETLEAKSDNTLAIIAKDFDYSGAFDRDAIIAQVLALQEHPRWVDGDLVRALRRGELVILDEVNLAPPEVLERINSLFDDDGNLRIAEHNGEVVERHKDFRIFATMNPSSDGNRFSLSKAYKSRLPPTWVSGMTEEDIRVVLQTRYKDVLPPKALAALVDVHMGLSRLAEDQGVGRVFGGVHYTIRNLMRVADRFAKFQGKGLSDGALLRREIDEVYLAGLEPNEARMLRKTTLDPIIPGDGKDPYEDLKLTRTKGGWKLGDLDITSLHTDSAYVPGTEAELAPTKHTLKNLYLVSKMEEMKENPYLFGEAASGKGATLKYYAYLKQLPYYRQNFQRDTETTDFLGSYDIEGWKNGLLTTAMEQGGLFMADELSLARGGIIERFNSLLERGRSIRLSEKDGSRLHAVQDFGYAATGNPATDDYRGRNRNSPAFLNRHTLLWLEPPDADDEKVISEFKARRYGLHEREVAQVVPALTDLQNWMRNAYAKGEIGKDMDGKDRLPLDIRQLDRTLDSIAKLRHLSKSETLSQAYVQSINANYLIGRSASDDATIMTKAKEFAVAAAGALEQGAK